MLKLNSHETLTKSTRQKPVYMVGERRREDKKPDHVPYLLGPHLTVVLFALASREIDRGRRLHIKSDAEPIHLEGFPHPDNPYDVFGHVTTSNAETIRMPRYGFSLELLKAYQIPLDSYQQLNRDGNIAFECYEGLHIIRTGEPLLELMLIERAQLEKVFKPLKETHADPHFLKDGQSLPQLGLSFKKFREEIQRVLGIDEYSLFLPELV
jgi:hypothetical protein